GGVGIARPPLGRFLHLRSAGARMSDGSTFPGWIIAPGATSRQAATIACTRAGVQADPRDGGAQASVSWSELRLEVGGAEGVMVFCHHRVTGAIICSDARGFLAELKTNSGGMLDEQVIGVATRNAASVRRRRALMLGSVLLVISLLAGAYLLA